MQLKTYTSPDVATALRQIKDELGPDAVIVETRQVRGRRGAFGLFRPGGVEITAAIEGPVGLGRTPARAVSAHRGAKRTYAVVGHEDEGPARTATPREAETPETGGGGRESVMFYIKPLRDEIRLLTSSVARIQEDLGARTEHTTSGGEFSQLRGEMIELRHMIGRMSDASFAPVAEGLPDPLRGIAVRLADAGVELSLLGDTFQRLAESLTETQLAEPGYAQECVLSAMMRRISVASPLERSEKRARVMALVGPTGVGKTTTVAKIAGNLRAENPKARMALLTLDTYRVGAVDHLRAYGEMLCVPVNVASTASELESLIRRHLDCDLVLIDTAGGNPRDERLMSELRSLICPNPLIETHLCLSATTKARDLREIADRFASLSVEKLIFTKIDETSSGGPLYNHLAQSGTPLAHITTGQQVPEDIEVASKDRLCRWVLGE